MAVNFRRLDLLRKGRGAVDNGLIDALVAGRVSRREFLRHGAAIGLSLPRLAAIASALAMAALPRHGVANETGGVLRVGQLVPRGAIDPVKSADSGGIAQLRAVGEYLCLSGPDMTLTPVLAESWSPSPDAKAWSFKIRKGVRFHDGKPMTADDVVATFERLADPDTESNALSLLAGYLSKGGTAKVDAETVAFHLDAAHGNFPYLVSSDNPNAIVTPAGQSGEFKAGFVATGPFKLDKYLPGVGSSFVRNGDYWGPRARADRIGVPNPATQHQ